MDGGLQHVAQLGTTVIAQEQHPAVEHTRHHRGEETRPRHELEPEGAVMGDGGPCRCRTLPADDLDALSCRTPEDDRHVAAEPVLIGLDHLQGEGCRARRIEGIAALLEARHGDGGGDPMGRGDDAEGALDLGPGGEHHGMRILGLQSAGAAL